MSTRTKAPPRPPPLLSCQKLTTIWVPLSGSIASDRATGQYFYLQGLLLASPSMARATTNLAPGITFAIAAIIG